MGTGGGFLAGAIVSKLMLDKSGFSASAKEAQGEAAGLAGAIQKHSATIKGIGTAMTAVGGAVVASLGAMIFKVVDTGESLSKLSKQTGVSVETLSALRLAAETNETSLEGIATGMKRLSMNMMEADDKGSKAAQMFKYLGIETRDSHGVLRDMNDVMLDVADRFKEMPDGAEKSEMAMKIFGKSGLDLIPMLNTGSKAIREQMEEAKKLGLVMTKEAAEGADNFGDRVTTLKLALKASTEHLVGSMMPALTSMVDKITAVVGKITAWMAAHPGLTDAIVKTAGALGVIMSVMGPMLLILPKIVAGFQAMKGLDIGSKLISQFTGLGASLGEAGISGILKKIPAVGVAAFIGWGIGTLLREIPGVDEAIGRLFDKLYKKRGEGSPIELLPGHFEAAKVRAEALAVASDLVGKSITNISDAQAILIAQYKEHGTTGSATLDAMVVGWDKNLTAVKTVGEVHKKTMGEMEAETEAAAKAEEDWATWIASTGIVTIDNQAKAWSEAKGHLKRLDDLLRDHKITQKEYDIGVRQVNEDLKGTKQQVTGLLPPARDLNGVIKLAAPAFADVNTFAYKYQQTLEKLGILTIRQTIDRTRELIREQADLKTAFDKGDISAQDYAKGMQKVQGDIRGVTTETTTATETMSTEWDGFFNQVGSKWGDLMGQFVDSIVEGKPMSIVTLWNRAWKTARETFFQVISQMIGSALVKEFKKLLTDLFSDVGKSATDMGKNIIDAGKTSETALGGVSTSLSGIGGLIANIGTGIGTAITAIATAVGTGITAIATGIASAITVLATAIATAATTLAAAAPALIIVGAIAIAIFAGFSAVKALFGGGGMASSAEANIKKIQISTEGLLNVLQIDIRDNQMNDIIWGIQSQLGGIMTDVCVKIDNLANILNTTIWEKLSQINDGVSGIITAIEGIGGAQAGHVSTQTELIMTHGTPSEPEITAPAANIINAVRSEGGKSVTLNFNPSFYIDAIDGNSVRKIVREKIGPELIAMLKANINKRQMMEAFGV
jgi:TP901 family phage tail tape measure protein